MLGRDVTVAVDDMSDQGLGKLWFIIGAGVAYLSINFWSYSQQWRVELPSIVKFNTEIGSGHRITHAAAIYGMMLLGPPLLLLLSLTAAYARRHAKERPAFRIPKVGGFGIDPASVTGRRVQIATALVLLGVPLAAQVHFFLKFIDGTAYKRSVSITGLDHFRYDSATAFDGGFRYDTVSYFPFIEPWLFAGLELVILALAVQTFRRIYL